MGLDGGLRLSPALEIAPNKGGPWLSITYDEGFLLSRFVDACTMTRISPGQMEKLTASLGAWNWFKHDTEINKIPCEPHLWSSVIQNQLLRHGFLNESNATDCSFLNLPTLQTCSWTVFLSISDRYVSRPSSLAAMLILQ